MPPNLPTSVFPQTKFSAFFLCIFPGISHFNFTGNPVDSTEELKLSTQKLVSSSSYFQLPTSYFLLLTSYLLIPHSPYLSVNLQLNA